MRRTWRRADQRRQRAVGSRDSAAGRLLRGQARAQGIYRRAAHGARGGRRAGSVTLVKPASIDTPFFEKARTYLASNRSRCRRCTRQRSSPTSSCTPPTPGARAHCRRLRGEAQCGAIRPAARRSLHGTVDVRFAAHRRTARRVGPTTSTSTSWQTTAENEVVTGPVHVLVRVAST